MKRTVTYPPFQRGLIPIVIAAGALAVLWAGLLQPISIALADDPTFFEIRPFGRGADYLRSVATGDLNGDGYLDIVAGSTVYVNDGEGGFFNGPATCGVTPNAQCFGTGFDGVNVVATGDLNNDGALDVIVADDTAARNAVYLNTGNGVFTTTAPYTRAYGSLSAATYAMAVGDMNNDGRLDIVVGNYGQQSLVYLNDGASNFHTGTHTCGVTPNVKCFGGITNTVGIAVGDLNGDGRLDIVAANRVAQISAYLNDGNGNFPTVRTMGGPTDGPSAFSASSLALGDLNGDGALDVVTRISASRGAIFYNDGLGNFNASVVTCGLTFNVECVGTGADDIFSLVAADMNNDGALDVALGNYNQQNVLYLNDGLGNFHYGAITCATTASVRCFGPGEDSSIGLAAADVNADGALDLVVGNNDGQQSNVYLNNGAGALPAGQVWGASGDQPAQVAVGDINGDGFLDLASANVGGQQSLVYLNDGAGGFYAGAANCGLTSRMRCLGTSSMSVSAWAFADLNGDSHLDAVVNPSGQAAVYLNGGTGTYATSVVSCVSPATMRCFGPAAGGLQSLATGDINGDGFLDIVAGRIVSGMVFLNNGAGSFPNGALTCATANVRCFGSDAHGTQEIVVGDVDKDGDLDIAVGNNYNQNAIYLNDGAGNFYAGEVTCGVTAGVRCVGNTVGEGGSLINGTLAIALSDVNGDGYLDFVEGNAAGSGQQNVLYLNDGSGTFYFGQVTCGVTPDIRCFGTGGDATWAMAVGDLNGDGAPDIVQGNPSQQNAIYLNNGAGDFPLAASWFFDPSTYLDDMRALAVGDLNNDGALDVAAGNYFGDQNMVYLNPLANSSLPNNPPRVSVSRPSRNAAFLSDAQLRTASTIPITYTLFDPEGDNVKFLRASYSPDGGGQWFPAVAASGTLTSNLPSNYAYLDSDTGGPAFSWIDISATGTPIVLGDEVVGGPYNLGFTFPFFGRSFSQFWISDNGWLTLSAPPGAAYFNYALPSPSAPANLIAPFWDDLNPGAGGSIRYQQVAPDTLVISYLGVPLYLGGGGTGALTFQVILRQNGSITFQYQTMSPGSLTLNSATIGVQNHDRTLARQAVYNAAYVHNSLAGRIDMTRLFNWDVAASGFFGQTDNMVFRLEAYPDTRPITNGSPGPYQHPYLAAQTFPFRVRGTQIRVMENGQPKPNALVYRLPAGQTTGGALLSSGLGTPFRTDAQGYLQGRGQLALGDQLLALAPITATDTYTIYHTNGTPTPLGVNAHTINATGVQTLTTSASNPLVLFNVYVSLEWDSSADPTYLDQLRFNLQRTSEYLYDFTNGQAALGQVIVEQNADDWGYANIAIHANNRLRPHAALGGIVTTETVDFNPVLSDVVYVPGQVHMGATWNRYGTPGTTLGDDWAIILAHELGHYLFFLDDVYLGLDSDGFLIPVDTCLGSAMGDLYSDPNNTELIFDDATWQANCAQTLAEQTLGRDEWETLTGWYTPTVTPSAINAGPSLMPFDFTAVEVLAPLTPTNPLVDPTFYLNYVNGGGSSNEARAYLLRGGNYLIDLGSPFGGQNRVRAWGAQPNDRLCVFDRPRTQFGCETLAEGDDQIQMRLDATWNPLVQVTPVNSTTLNIQLQAPGAAITYPVQVRIFPEFGPGTAPATFALVGSTYTRTITLTEPALNGQVQIWVDEPYTEGNPRRETIIAYAIGGNPGSYRAGGGSYRAGGGSYRAGGGSYRAGGGSYRAGGAPVVSPDGQMIFFTENPIIFDEGEFFTIQGMAALPALPPGRTVIGSGYRLVATPGTPVITGSVSIQYLSNDVTVAGASEDGLSIYFFNGTTWTELPTTRSPFFNLVTAPSQGVGVYGLMASVQVPLYTAGWNLFAYPLQGSQVVTDALASIDGYYSTVYGYYAEDTADPWKLYQVGAYTYVNDLLTLDFGRGYWISATQAITIHFSPTPNVPVALPASPPDTFYGQVLSGGGFVPTAGQVVRAYVGSVLCGQGMTQDVGGQIVYVVDVFADDETGQWSGCGQVGQTVRFVVAGQSMSPTALWNNATPTELNLAPGQALYLPLMRR